MRQLVIFIAVVFPLLAAAQSSGTIVEDIPYSHHSDRYSAERCKLDVYSPEDAKDLPTVVWFHGGGLTGGSKEIPQKLKDSGLVVVGVNYRLLPTVDVTDCIDDAAAAVAWTFRNIEKYGGSPEKIIVSGHSAGGYLTSMVGLDKSWLRKYGVDADSIALLVPYSGQVITHFSQRKKQGIGELQPTIDATAPLFHVRKDAPPYIIITGDREQELYGRYEENAYMWRMMKLTGHEDNHIYELDGYNHGEMAEPAHHILKKEIRKRFPKQSQL